MDSMYIVGLLSSWVTYIYINFLLLPNIIIFSFFFFISKMQKFMRLCQTKSTRTVNGQFQVLKS
ncbi:hypothetical protein CR513_02977, partial [Mucuna pruriens]